MHMQDPQQQSLSTKELQHKSHTPPMHSLMDQALHTSDHVRVIGECSALSRHRNDISLPPLGHNFRRGIFLQPTPRISRSPVQHGTTRCRYPPCAVGSTEKPSCRQRNAHIRLTSSQLHRTADERYSSSPPREKDLVRCLGVGHGEAITIWYGHRHRLQSSHRRGQEHGQLAWAQQSQELVWSIAHD